MAELPKQPQENQSLEHWRASYEAMREERDELQRARNELWIEWNTRDLACRAAEATVARLLRAIGFAVNYINAIANDGDVTGMPHAAAARAEALLRDALSASPTGENSNGKTTKI